MILVLEFHMALGVVAAHAQDDRAFRRHPAEVVPEATRFLRATGRVVLRIEIEDNFLSPKVFQRHLASVVRGQCEVRRPFAYRQHRRTGATHTTAQFNVTDSSIRRRANRNARLRPILYQVWYFATYPLCKRTRVV